MLSLIQKPAKSLKKWPLSWNRLYLIWFSTLNMALTLKMTNLHTGANLNIPLNSKNNLVRVLILREKGGVHWEGGSAHVRERLRQEVVIKALHQVAPGSIHFPHLATRCWAVTWLPDFHIWWILRRISMREMKLFGLEEALVQISPWSKRGKAEEILKKKSSGTR